MRRIVLDTNCLLQALPSCSPYHKIWTEVMAGRISLCVNSDILSEYEGRHRERHHGQLT
jgi:predicted nucleic acid-binding protein